MKFDATGNVLENSSGRRGRKLVLKRGRKIVAKAVFAPGFAQRKRAKRLLRGQYGNRGVKINPRKRPAARNVTEAMRNIGRRALAKGGADHFVQVRRGNSWISLAAFFEKNTAVDYGRAIARKYPHAQIRYFHPDEAKRFKKNPDALPGKCACEHKAHFGEGKTPNGNFGHKYWVKFSQHALRDVKTPYGTFRVCIDCAADCMDGFKKNPTELSASGEAAARRLEAFTGHEAARARRVPIPTADAGLEIGPCLLIGYETTRDGKREKYIHRFSQHARPLLAASSDGRSLFLLGGAYRFTERGIVDKR